MEKDGTEPRLGILAGQGRREMLKTGEDGEGWCRTQTWHPGWTREEGDAQDRRRWRRMVQNPDLASWLDKGGGRCSRQEKMEKDGAEPRLGILAGQGRREMLKTGEDGEGWYRTQTLHRGWSREEGDGQDRRRWRRMVQNPDLASWLDKGGGRCSRQEKMEKDGAEPRLGILAGQGRREMLKTGEDEEGWYRTQTWHPGWTREKGDAQDRRRWRRMVENPDLASWLDKGGGRCSRQEKMEKDGTEPRLGILAGQGEEEEEEQCHRSSVLYVIVQECSCPSSMSDVSSDHPPFNYIDYDKSWKNNCG